MDKVYVGKISGFHGVKGELKVVSDFDFKDRVFKSGFPLIINGEVLKVSSSRVHKNNYLITLNEIFNLNDVDKYIGLEVFANRCDLHLSDGEYLLFDLIDFSVYDEDVFLGKVKNIVYNKNNNFLYVENFYIPLIDVYIKSVDLVNKKIETINGKDLII